MIKIEYIKKIYNKKIVLSIDYLLIPQGELLGIVGNNGAGKTTLFRLFLDLIQADDGIIYSANEIISKSENWKDYTAAYLDYSFLIDFLSPEEFFYFIGDIYKYKKEEILDKLNIFNGFFNNEILHQKNKYIRDFSEGNKQKIGIISCLITDPKVLILDEPFNHLDPTSQFLLKKILIEYRRVTKSTVIISSHDLKHITDICDRIILLERGNIIKDLQNDFQTLNQLENYFSID
jgi:ABC-2 type transport system ATP-binding protein